MSDEAPRVSGPYTPEETPEETWQQRMAAKDWFVILMLGIWLTGVLTIWMTFIWLATKVAGL